MHVLKVLYETEIKENQMFCIILDLTAACLFHLLATQQEEEKKEEDEEEEALFSAFAPSEHKAHNVKQNK